MVHYGRRKIVLECRLLAYYKPKDNMVRLDCFNIA